jgi:hypothetical protein
MGAKKRPAPREDIPGAGETQSIFQTKYTTKPGGLSRDFIEQALNAGLSIIPTNPDTKKPTISWKPYQASPMSHDQVKSLDWPGVAIIAGKVSGNLECLDFDHQADWFDAWAEIVETEAPGLVDRLTQQTTQSGGKHIVYLCPGAEIPGNKKLASDKEGRCYIETRGEGGYFLADPTPGYSLENGDFLNLPEITPAERENLIRSAAALNRYVKPKYHKQPTVDGDRPGDIYNQQADPGQLLEKHGWRLAGTRGDYSHWTRPGKDRGISGSLIDGKIFHAFTSNGPPLEPDTAYSPFHLLTALEYNGDFEAAAKELWRQGYRNEQAEEPVQQSGIRPVSIAEFLAMEFPPRNNILNPWVPKQGIIMIYAYRGIGKTFFALAIGYAAASGGRFLTWDAPAPVGVLYLDGEMPAPVMQQRVSQIVAGANQEPQAPFIIMTPDLQPEGMPRIDTPEGQAAIESIMTPEIKLIVVDNISTLSCAEENKADAWTPVQAWALKQRQRGRTVCFIHHAGKGGA